VLDVLLRLEHLPCLTFVEFIRSSNPMSAFFSFLLGGESTTFFVTRYINHLRQQAQVPTASGPVAVGGAVPLPNEDNRFFCSYRDDKQFFKPCPEKINAEQTFLSKVNSQFARLPQKRP
jgi:hypothetical protein